MTEDDVDSEPTTTIDLSANLDPALRQGSMVGEYEVIREIGRGGMGLVLEGLHPILGKRVAIKVLLPHLVHEGEMVKRFLREARALNDIGHDGIVDVFGFGELADGRPYFTMEFLRGEDLSDYAARGPMTIFDVCRVVRRAADAVQAAHAAGVIHRDLKPENVFLVGEGGQWTSVKVLDFGIAKLYDNTSVEHLTATGVLMGTPRYMAPEQARNEEVTGAADIYSLGILLYELITRALAYRAKRSMDLVLQHVRSPVPDPRKLCPELPDELAQLIMQMMSKFPHERPSLLEVRDVLERHEGVPRPATIVPRPTTLAPVERPETAGDAAPSSSGFATLPAIVPERPGHEAPGEKRPKSQVWYLLGAGLVLALAGLGARLASGGSADGGADGDAPSAAFAVQPGATDDHAPSATTTDSPAEPLATIAPDATIEPEHQADAAIEPASNKPPQIQTGSETVAKVGGLLIVRSSSDAAQVFVDGVRRGTGAQVRVEVDDDQKHTILVKAPGYNEVRKVMRIRGEQEVEIALRTRKKRTGSKNTRSDELISDPF